MSHTTTVDADLSHQTKPVRDELVEAQATLMALRSDPAALTIAARAVLHRLASGHTNAQIGRHLGRSERTVRNQLTRVYAKLGVANRAEAVAMHLRTEYGRGS